MLPFLASYPQWSLSSYAFAVIYVLLHSICRKTVLLQSYLVKYRFCSFRFVSQNIERRNIEQSKFQFLFALALKPHLKLYSSLSRPMHIKGCQFQIFLTISTAPELTCTESSAPCTWTLEYTCTDSQIPGTYATLLTSCFIV